MTRLKSRARSDAQAGFGTLFSTVAALTSPVQGMLDRPFYGDVPQLAVRPGVGSGPRARCAAALAASAPASGASWCSSTTACCATSASRRADASARPRSRSGAPERPPAIEGEPRCPTVSSASSRRVRWQAVPPIRAASIARGGRALRWRAAAAAAARRSRRAGAASRGLRRARRARRIGCVRRRLARARPPRERTTAGAAAARRLTARRAADLCSADKRPLGEDRTAMMLEHLRRMARYNRWANQRLYAACGELPERGVPQAAARRSSARSTARSIICWSATGSGSPGSRASRYPDAAARRPALRQPRRARAGARRRGRAHDRAGRRLRRGRPRRDRCAIALLTQPETA